MGVSVEGVDGIQGVVFLRFEKNFKSNRIESIGVDNLQFSAIDEVDAYSLVRLFSEDEIKRVVQECASFKSPCPNKVNFGFYKKKKKIGVK